MITFSKILQVITVYSGSCEQYESQLPSDEAVPSSSYQSLISILEEIDNFNAETICALDTLSSWESYITTLLSILEEHSPEPSCAYSPSPACKPSLKPKCSASPPQPLCEPSPVSSPCDPIPKSCSYSTPKPSCISTHQPPLHSCQSETQLNYYASPKFECHGHS